VITKRTCDRLDPNFGGEIEMIDSTQPIGLREVSASASPAVCEISVKIDAGGTHAFFIILGADGTIRRRQGGPAGSDEADLVIGTANPALFEEVRALITPQLLKWCRPLRPVPAPRGELRELEVRLKQSDGKELMSRWQVEAESSGPPAQVIEFASATVRATNRWYEREKEQQSPRPRLRPQPGWHLVS
jgi:hypothetical protein